MPEDDERYKGKKLLMLLPPLIKGLLRRYKGFLMIMLTLGIGEGYVEV